jgi:hypothetical protein
MEGIDGVSMNIIHDAFTPVHATAAAQGVSVARASAEQLQLPDSNHWQTDLNRVVARDYQVFTTESWAAAGASDPRGALPPPLDFPARGGDISDILFVLREDDYAG